MSKKSASPGKGVTLVVLVLLSVALALSAAEAAYKQTNLVSDVSGQGAVILDANLKNAWGISHSATSSFWVSNNGTGLATLYNVNPINGAVTKLGLEVTIPGAGNPTGQVFNSTNAKSSGTQV